MCEGNQRRPDERTAAGEGRTFAHVREKKRARSLGARRYRHFEGIERLPAARVDQGAHVGHDHLNARVIRLKREQTPERRPPVDQPTRCDVMSRPRPGLSRGSIGAAKDDQALVRLVKTPRRNCHPTDGSTSSAVRSRGFQGSAHRDGVLRRRTPWHGPRPVRPAAHLEASPRL